MEPMLNILLDAKSIFPIKKIIKYKYDLIFVYAPSPATVGITGIFLKKILKIPLIYWVHDLWPESVKSAGNLKSNLIPNLLVPVIKIIYNYSDILLVSSPGFIDSIVQKGVKREKIHYFPQWAEDIFVPVLRTDKKFISVPEKSFKIMFAGNIGEAQDFPSIVEAAKILKNNTDIHWIILGGGRKEKWVRDKIKEYKLEKCFHMLGSFPIEKMPEFYAEADCMLFSLKDEYIFSKTIPAKVQSYLACGKPILAMINGEGSKIIEDANAGLTCPAENPKKLVENIIIMKEMRHESIIKIGRNARKYYDRNFERSFLLNKAEKLFSAVRSNSLK